MSRNSSAGSRRSPISAALSANCRPGRPDALRTDQPARIPDPDRAHSAGAKAGNTVYVSGVLALGEGGTVLHVGDAAAQTRHVLEVIKTTLAAAGATMADVAMNHIFLKDLGDYAAFNAVYAEYFPGAKPARYCIKCELVKPDCLVEIASVAHIV
ncbi:MAG: Rid family hydrolase [Sphingomonas taxi]